MKHGKKYQDSVKAFDLALKSVLKYESLLAKAKSVFDTFNSDKLSSLTFIFVAFFYTIATVYIFPM